MQCIRLHIRNLTCFVLFNSFIKGVKIENIKDFNVTCNLLYFCAIASLKNISHAGQYLRKETAEC